MSIEKEISKKIATQLIKVAETHDSHDWSNFLHRQDMLNAIIIAIRPYLKNETPEAEIMAGEIMTKLEEIKQRYNNLTDLDGNQLAANYRADVGYLLAYHKQPVSIEAGARALAGNTWVWWKNEIKAIAAIWGLETKP